MGDVSSLAAAEAATEERNSFGFGDLFGTLAESAIDLGVTYAEHEIYADDRQAVAAPESAEAATLAGKPSGITLDGVARQLPGWAIPAAATVAGVVVITLIFR